MGKTKKGTWMTDEDISMLKSLRGTIYYSHDYLCNEMSEHVIFDKGKPDRELFDAIVDDLRRLGPQVTILIKKYDGRNKK